MPDDDARDEDLAAMLEVERLDELERKRLVTTAMRAGSGPERSAGVPARHGARAPAGSRVRTIVAAAAVFIVIAVGAIALVALPGSDDDGRPTAAAPGSRRDLEAASPGTEAASRDSEAAAPTSDGAQSTPPPAGSGAPDTAASDTFGGPRSVPEQQAGVVYAGAFGDLESSAERERLLLALDPVLLQGGAANSTTSSYAQALAALPCATDLPDGTRVAYADARVGEQAAVVVVTRLADGSRSIDVVLSNPCSVRELG